MMQANEKAFGTRRPAQPASWPSVARCAGAAHERVPISVNPAWLAPASAAHRPRPGRRSRTAAWLAPGAGPNHTPPAPCGSAPAGRPAAGFVWRHSGVCSCGMRWACRRGEAWVPCNCQVVVPPSAPAPACLAGRPLHQPLLVQQLTQGGLGGLPHHSQPLLVRRKGAAHQPGHIRRLPHAAGRGGWRCKNKELGACRQGGSGPAGVGLAHAFQPAGWHPGTLPCSEGGAPHLPLATPSSSSCCRWRVASSPTSSGLLAARRGGRGGGTGAVTVARRGVAPCSMQHSSST